jgi:hypothetical protein
VRIRRKKGRKTVRIRQKYGVTDIRHKRVLGNFVFCWLMGQNSYPKIAYKTYLLSVILLLVRLQQTDMKSYDSSYM